jgi:type IV secretory pathway protease TraF
MKGIPAAAPGAGAFPARIPRIVPAALLFSVFALFSRPPKLFFINTTESLPRGIYRVSGGPPRLNDYVIINTHNINFDFERPAMDILKIMRFNGNETIEITGEYLMVNNAIKYKKYHSIGIRYAGKLKDTECLILGNHERSLDSRYFGKVNKSDCRRVVPLFLVDKP